jgi:hypothetical protein
MLAGSSAVPLDDSAVDAEDANAVRLCAAALATDESGWAREAQVLRQAAEASAVADRVEKGNRQVRAQVTVGAAASGAWRANPNYFAAEVGAAEPASASTSDATGEGVKGTPALVLADTGADRACVRRSLVAKAGLSPVPTSQVGVETAGGHVPVSGEVKLRVHRGDGGFVDACALVMEELPGGADLILGCNELRDAQVQWQRDTWDPGGVSTKEPSSTTTTSPGTPRVPGSTGWAPRDERLRTDAPAQPFYVALL